jgi:DNA-binding response OmpR family regulator
MGIRDYLKNPAGCGGINRAIRSAFERKRGGGRPVLRILVVDDDPLTRETMVRTLQRASYDTLGAEDGNQALEMFDERPFDLVITDIFMPERDGLETINELRLRDPEVKIVAVSEGGEGERYRRAARSFGAAMTLQKPFDTDQLLRAIKSVFKD